MIVLIAIIIQLSMTFNTSLPSITIDDIEVEVSMPLMSDESVERLINNLWTIGFTGIVVTGTCGNGIVLWIIMGEFKSLLRIMLY